MALEQIIDNTDYYYRALFWGDKRSFVMQVCDVWTELYLPAEQLYYEMSLMTPTWFSAMLSHRMLARFSRNFEKVTDFISLKPKLSTLSTSNDINLILVADNFTHKLIGKTT